MKLEEVEHLYDKLKKYLEIDTNDCILYEYIDSDGYGIIQWNVDKKKKRNGVHRIIYQLINKIDLKTDDVIMHSCDNPSCCNIKHLSLGTHADNNKDMVNKKRNAIGIKNGRYTHGKYTKEAKAIPKVKKEMRDSKIYSYDEIVNIKRKLHNGGCSMIQLSKQLNVSYQLLKDIKRGKSYNGVKF